MAVVSRLSIADVTSVKKAVKKGLTQRLKSRVGISDSSSSESESEEERPRRKTWRRKRSSDSEVTGGGETDENNDATLRGDGVYEKDYANGGNGSSPERERFSFKKHRRRSKRGKIEDLEMGRMDSPAEESAGAGPSEPHTQTTTTSGQKSKKGSFVHLPKQEQSMPADAVMKKENVNEFLQSFDPLVAPLGIITLEDVLEGMLFRDPSMATCAHAFSSSQS